MKAINYHIRGIITSFEYLIKGKFLIFFVPGLVLTALFWYYGSTFREIDESVDVSAGYSWLGWLDSSFSWLLSIGDWMIETVYIFLVLTLLSPFFTALGEKFDKELTGYEVDGGFIRFINDFLRMIFIIIISLLLQGVCIFIYWLIDAIIGFPEIMDEVVKYAINGFWFGFAFYDFALERHAKGVGGSIAFAFSAPLGMIIIGVIFKAIYAIPYVGIPLAPVLVVMISTVAYAYYTKQLPKTKELSNE